MIAPHLFSRNSRKRKRSISTYERMKNGVDILSARMSTLKNGPIRIVEKDTCLNCWNITTGNKITKTPNYVLNCAPVAARGRRVLDEGVDWNFLLFRLLSDVTGDELALHCRGFIRQVIWIIIWQICPEFSCKSGQM